MITFAGCDPVELMLAYAQHSGVPTPSKFSRDPILVALGSEIRKRRMELHMSQERLAELAQLDRSYLGQVERGENSIALHPLVRIAHSLDVSVAQLFKDADL